jgi:hypothetical protein
MQPTYPAHPTAQGTPASTPVAPALSIDETIRAIAAADDLLSGLRADLDNAARGRRYRKIQALAGLIQDAAKVGQQRTEELERLQAARQGKK